MTRLTSGLVTRHSSLVTRHSSLVTRHSSLVALLLSRRSLPIAAPVNDANNDDFAAGIVDDVHDEIRRPANNELACACDDAGTSELRVLLEVRRERSRTAWYRQPSHVSCS